MQIKVEYEVVKIVSAQKAYKFQQEGVLSESSNTSSKAENEHDTSYDNEEPHRVEAP